LSDGGAVYKKNLTYSEIIFWTVVMGKVEPGIITLALTRIGHLAGLPRSQLVSGACAHFVSGDRIQKVSPAKALWRLRA
jgi:hypothetical protein